MKKIVVILLALACATLVASPVHSANGDSWDRWGIQPYASSIMEACRQAPVAISGFTMPSEVKEYFLETVRTGCPGGKEAWLTPNMVLEQMWSGGEKPRLMNKRRVAELPVSSSPDGRPYRKGSVAETAKAFSWGAIHEGKMYIVYLPLVCFNWSWAFGPDAPPSPPLPRVLASVAEKCATVEYTVKPGDEVRYFVLARKRLQASACWQLCDGTNCSAPPSSCDWCDRFDPESIIPAGFETQHTGKYTARSAKQSLRFPLEIASSYLALCVTRAELGQSDSWVVQPSAWKGGAIVQIPYGGQKWPAWGHVDYSKWEKAPRKE